MDYSKIMNPTVQNIKPSGIRKFFDLLSTRKGVISLTVGEPDFQTPWHIRAAGITSLEKGKTHYTSNSGTPQLREAISTYLNRRFNISYDPASEVIVTVGGSEAIALAMRTLICPGDEVIIPLPAFVCYAPICEMCGGVPVFINTKEENRFKLTAE
ncbi:MAG: aminotransferase class I/II-fold pyridoxal phosphate-dependent enzyme, partial [Clostridia bacterium]|nr:aminotransferase class I/II-fold pyridoxal phosphate-dependent enzyme [Clostridia bacterium]